MKTFLAVGFACLALTACQPSATNQNTTANANAATPESTTATAPKDYSVKPPVFANSALTRRKLLSSFRRFSESRNHGEGRRLRAGALLQLDQRRGR